MGNEENNNEVNTDQQDENIETGQNGDNGNQNGSSGAESASEKTFTQAEVNRMMTKEKQQGRSAAYKELGIDPSDTNMVSMFKAFIEAQKTSEQKANEQKAENDAKLAQAMEKARVAEAKATALKLGVKSEYVDDVASANSVLVAGTAEYTITAEPAISKIKDAKGINVIDLQDEYKKVTGKDSYPQAGIFIKKEAKEDSKVLNAVDALVNSVKDAVENPANTAKKAVAMHKSFETVGEAALTKAIPNCHFIIMNHDKEVAAVNEYLQYMIDLEFGKQAGDKLPNEEFFL